MACQTVTQAFENFLNEGETSPSVTEAPILSDTPLPGAEPLTTSDLLETPTADVIETFILSEDEQESILDDLWETVNEEYLYADFNGLDWRAVRNEYRQLIKTGISDQEFEEQYSVFSVEYDNLRTKSKGIMETARTTLRALLGV